MRTMKNFFIFYCRFSGLWAFLCFVGFCYLTNAWNKSTAPTDGYGVNNVQGAIAFLFFSIFSWVSNYKLFTISIIN